MKNIPAVQISSYQNSFATITYYGAILGIAFTLVFVLIYGLTGFPPVVIALNFIACLFSIIGLITLRIFKRPLAAAHMITLCIFTAFFGPGLFTGGINSSSMVWLVLVPAVAALMAGKRASLIWSLITLLSAAGVFLLNRLWMIDLTIRPSDSIDRFIDLAAVMLATMVATWLNENTKQRIMNQLDNIQTRLEAANQELEAFVYSVSHDLRAPQRSINGFSQLLMEENGASLDESGKRYLDHILSSSKHMGQLIEDLLKLSRVTHAEMWIINVDLCTLLRDSVFDLRAIQPEKQVEIIMPEKLIVQGDPNLLRIALNNLVTNAWKFTGKIPHAYIELGSFSKDAQRVFFIKDNGAGFNMAHASKLFGVFHRLHSSTDFEGTGIGLTIVQRIIQRHGGRIWADAVEDQGATFYFTLN